MAQSVVNRVELRLSDPLPVTRRNLADPEAGTPVANEHVGGKFHPCRTKAQGQCDILSKSAISSLAIGDLDPAGRTANEKRQERRTNISMEARHSLPGGPFEPVAYH